MERLSHRVPIRVHEREEHAPEECQQDQHAAKDRHAAGGTAARGALFGQDLAAGRACAIRLILWTTLAVLARNPRARAPLGVLFLRRDTGENQTECERLAEQSRAALPAAGGGEHPRMCLALLAALTYGQGRRSSPVHTAMPAVYALRSLAVVPR